MHLLQTVYSLGKTKTIEIIELLGLLLKNKYIC